MKKVSLINAYMVFFIIHTAQIGVGIIGVPRIIFLESKQDAWIVVLFAGIIINLLIWVMFQILSRFENKDLYQIHCTVFGEKIGKLFNFVLTIYFIIAYYSIMNSYIEMALSWGYEGIYEWVGSFILIFISVYAVMGGFRVIVGICFLTFLLTIWLVFVIYQPLDHVQWIRISPVFNSNLTELSRGIFRSTYTMLGFETLFFIYPFIKEKNKVHFFAQLAVVFTTCLVCMVTLLSVIYFSPAQLEKTIWPSLTMLSIVKFPFVERFEYIAISFWILVILPNLSLFLWIATRGLKDVFRIKQKYAVWIISVILWILSFVVTERVENNTFIDVVTLTGFYLWFCYPLFLYIVTFFKKKKKNG
ncbi:GerAB/ArcD/ProY family transporter [uncultured Metabacillus sp.]|uniref:GerAB/ArcD/ProY family transporter n=1 Tax=uncultured Metabacillus sp. TaxID=2860135 RepID=UPI002621A68A|nr:GerAB/ArcD/ProY family transporter [uncultured Metabacillus sp.]